MGFYMADLSDAELLERAKRLVTYIQDDFNGMAEKFLMQVSV
jgi:hypothetical protein